MTFHGPTTMSYVHQFLYVISNHSLLEPSLVAASTPCPLLDPRLRGLLPRDFYVIEMVVNANPDDDVGNDAKQVFVTVEDWYDIELELVWNSGIEVESGAGTKDWTLTVTADGSDTFDPREVQVRLQSVGAVSAAQDINGNSIDSSTTNLYTAGTIMTVDIFENISTEPATITTGVRNVLSTWTLTRQSDCRYGCS